MKITRSTAAWAVSGAIGLSVLAAALNLPIKEHLQPRSRQMAMT